MSDRDDDLIAVPGNLDRSNGETDNAHTTVLSLCYIDKLTVSFNEKYYIFPERLLVYYACYIGIWRISTVFPFKLPQGNLLVI